MTTETYTEADQRAEALLDSILTKPHTESAVAKAVRAGNIWRALSNGEGWDPEPKNPIDTQVPEETSAWKGWIDVRERLPPNACPVLVAHENEAGERSVSIGAYRYLCPLCPWSSDEAELRGLMGAPDPGPITFWQPLPEAPRTEKEDQP